MQAGTLDAASKLVTLIAAFSNESSAKPLGRRGRVAAALPRGSECAQVVSLTWSDWRDSGCKHDMTT